MSLTKLYIKGIKTEYSDSKKTSEIKARGKNPSTHAD